MTPHQLQTMDEFMAFTRRGTARASLGVHTGLLRMCRARPSLLAPRLAFTHRQRHPAHFRARVETYAWNLIPFTRA